MFLKVYVRELCVELAYFLVFMLSNMLIDSSSKYHPSASFLPDSNSFWTPITSFNRFVDGCADDSCVKGE